MKLNYKDSKTDRAKKPIKIYKKAGLPPGSLVFTGDRKVNDVTLIVTTFDENGSNKAIIHNGDITKIKHGSNMTWIDVMGIHDIKLIELFGKKYDINSLLLEDILDVDQVPKYLELDNGNFLSFQSFSYDKLSHNIAKEQMSIYFNNDVIISFQEDAIDTFAPIHDLISQTKNRFKSRKPDYIAYTLMDLVVDNYRSATQYFEDRIEDFELEIEKNPGKELKQLIFSFRREFLQFMKAVTPIQEAISKFKLSSSESIYPDTKIYLADLLDHSVQVSNNAETYNEMIYGLYDLFHAEINYRANSIIKTLTVISSIFIPLTFIVGVYGMNFDHMPELRWDFGYYAVWIFMITFVVIILAYFRWRKWI